MNSAVYIDGYNFYHGIHKMIVPTNKKRNGWQEVLFPDIVDFFNDFCQKSSITPLAYVSLIMSRPRTNQLFQITDFNEYITDLHGKYPKQFISFLDSGYKEHTGKEKGVDVRIAAQIFLDIFTLDLDHIILVSADSDFDIIIQMIISNKVNKKFTLVIPPGFKLSQNRSKTMKRIKKRNQNFNYIKLNSELSLFKYHSGIKS